MGKRLFWLLLLATFVSCSTQDDNSSEENELDPKIEITLNPGEEPVPYNSDVTLNWIITNATSAKLDGEEIDLIGTKTFEDLKVEKTFEITAVNINKSGSLLNTITVEEEPSQPLQFEFVFTETLKYFSTDGSMTRPVSKETALSSGIVGKIDLSYCYEQNDHDPGFMDPIARSKDLASWDIYSEPWLSEGVETVLYKSHLNLEFFEAAKNDEKKINEYFEDGKFTVSTCYNTPNGSYIGADLSTTSLKTGMVVGFVNKGSGKKGMIYIPTNQQYAWPHAIVGFDTRVQIIRER